MKGRGRRRGWWGCALTKQRDLMKQLELIGVKLTGDRGGPSDSSKSRSTHRSHAERLSPRCLMEPSYGLLIGQTAARLIYFSNQALINGKTLVRPPLKSWSLFTAGAERKPIIKTRPMSFLSQSFSPLKPGGRCSMFMKKNKQN